MSREFEILRENILAGKKGTEVKELFTGGKPWNALIFTLFSFNSRSMACVLSLCSISCRIVIGTSSCSPAWIESWFCGYCVNPTVRTSNASNSLWYSLAFLIMASLRRSRVKELSGLMPLDDPGTSAPFQLQSISFLSTTRANSGILLHHLVFVFEWSEMIFKLFFDLLQSA